jgi:hypothetical protein
MAAGISTVSHWAPPNNAAMPSMTKIAVALVDFFKSALIRTTETIKELNYLRCSSGLEFRSPFSQP